MTAIITEKFRQHNATQFFESFSETASNAYYLFIGKATPFTTGTSGGSDGSPPTPSDSVGQEFYVWDDMLAAKRFLPLMSVMQFLGVTGQTDQLLMPIITW